MLRGLQLYKTGYIEDLDTNSSSSSSSSELDLLNLKKDLHHKAKINHEASHETKNNKIKRVTYSNTNKAHEAIVQNYKSVTSSFCRSRMEHSRIQRRIPSSPTKTVKLSRKSVPSRAEKGVQTPPDWEYQDTDKSTVELFHGRMSSARTARSVNSLTNTGNWIRGKHLSPRFNRQPCSRYSDRRKPKYRMTQQKTSPNLIDSPQDSGALPVEGPAAAGEMHCNNPSERGSNESKRLFPFKITPSGNLKIVPNQVVYESKKVSILVADPIHTRVNVKTELRDRSILYTPKKSSIQTELKKQAKEVLQAQEERELKGTQISIDHEVKQQQQIEKEPHQEVSSILVDFRDSKISTVSTDVPYQQNTPTNPPLLILHSISNDISRTTVGTSFIPEHSFSSAIAPVKNFPQMSVSVLGPADKNYLAEGSLFFAVREAVLVFGGVDPHSQYGLGHNTGRDLYHYQPESNSWKLVGELPEPHHHYSVAFLKGLVYLVGGADPQDNDVRQKSVIVNTVWSYEPVTRSWFSESGKLIPRKNFGSRVSNALGGLERQGRWKPFNGLQFPRSSFTVNDTSYLTGNAGCLTESDQTTSTIDAIDICWDTRKKQCCLQTEMVIPELGHSIAYLGTQILIIGGVTTRALLTALKFSTLNVGHGFMECLVFLLVMAPLLFFLHPRCKLKY